MTGCLGSTDRYQRQGSSEAESNAHEGGSKSRWNLFIQKYTFGWVSPLLTDIYYRERAPLEKEELFNMMSSQSVKSSSSLPYGGKSTCRSFVLDSGLDDAIDYPKNRLDSAYSEVACGDKLVEEFEIGLNKSRNGLPALCRSAPSSDYISIPLKANSRTSFASDESYTSPARPTLAQNQLFWHVVSFRGKQLLFLGLLKFMADIASILIPVVLSRIITAVKSDPEYEEPHHPDVVTDAHLNVPFYSPGLAHVVILLVLLLVHTCVNNTYQYHASICALQVKTAISSAMYRKWMRIDSGSKSRFDSAKLINMLTIDGLRIENFIAQLHNMWSSPLLVAIVFTLMAHEIGLACLAGIGFMVLSCPLYHSIWQRLRHYRKETAPVTDLRIQKVKEFLVGAKVIKYFAWESVFFDQIQDIRREETGQILQKSLLNALSEGVIFNTALLASCFTLMLYGLDHDLDPAVIFPLLAWFHQLRYPMMFLPKTLVAYADFKVAIERFSELFECSDMIRSHREQKNGDLVVIMNQASFSWQRPINEKTLPAIKYLTVNIKRGRRVAIVGPNGCGKTSLLHAILGEMYLYAGSSFRQGTASFVSQHSWLMNGTIRDNILFGRPFHKSKYRSILKKCALDKDMELLADGDNTIIGNGGFALSGGQRQRINLARALYVESDLYLLDDPFCVIDARIVAYLFENVLNTLESKTLILVTHRADWLPRFEHIIYMRRGRIIEQGSYSELCVLRGEFSKWANLQKRSTANIVQKEGKQVTDVLGQTEHVDSNPWSEPTNSTYQESSYFRQEERAVGAVKANVCMWYLQAAGGWPCVLGFLLLLLVINMLKIATDYWLVICSDKKLHTLGYVGIYSFLAISQALTLLLMGALLTIVLTKAARCLHDQALKTLFAARMSFFLRNPVGRILNRFSKDQDVVDYGLSDSIRILLNTMSSGLTLLLMIVLATPLSIFPIIPLLYGYYYLQQVFRPAARELKRLDSVLESPLLTHIEQSVSGLTIIRTHQNQKQFQDIFDAAMSDKNASYYFLLCSQRWLGMRMDALGSAIVFLAALFGVLGKGNIHPSILGLSLSYAIQVTGTLNYCVHQFTETEIAMNAVERLYHYGHDLELEDVAAELPRQVAVQTGSNRFSIEFQNVTLECDGHSILKNISFRIEKGKKTAMIGPTGSGKSTLISLMMRLFEPSEGKIIIHGHDIATIPLAQLRSSMAVLPQDPIIFTGSLRMNLDPYTLYSDGEIWTILEALDLDDTITEMGGLSTTLHNVHQLSVGKRQLLCLARALLARPPVLILDEATCNMDVESEKLIQSCIFNPSSDMTVIHILHRLDQVLDYDCVLVISQGALVEYDTPQALLTRPKSMFSKLFYSTVGPFV